MSRIKQTPKDKGHTVLFQISKEEAEKADILKLAGPTASPDLIACIKDWIERRRPGKPETLPTHRLKKAWLEQDLPVGTLFYVPKKMWIPPMWTWTDTGEVYFYKTRGRWVTRRMRKVNEQGLCDGLYDIFDYDETWGRKYLEPIRRKKE